MPQPTAATLHRLGSLVRSRRKLLGLSQEKLAERAGLHVNYVGGVERGERNIGFVNLVRLAEALEWEVSDLVARFDSRKV